MRITNKIIQNNSLTNINTNKTLEDKLSTMISTEKKISRPSDDPIVALRSLRLRTSVNQTDQYLNKNVEDANSWLTVTEDAIDTLSDILTDIRKQYVKGSSDSLTSSDRKIILEDLQTLAAEVYNTGNVDFAGRSVFTGYRTSSALTFQKEEVVNYTITEDESTATLDTTLFVKADGATEQDVYSADITRIRLSYDALSTTKPETDADGNVTTVDATPTVTINGTEYSGSAITTISTSGTDNPYEYVHDNSDAIVFVPETGEILIGSDYGDTDSITSFSVTYSKEEWDSGDLRPEHYFDCTDNTNNIVYSSHGGEIEYNVGVNQSLRINTTADECFNHSIVRDLDDIMNALKEVQNIEDTITKLTSELNALPESDTAGREAKQAEIDAAEKAQTYLNEKLHNLFETGITKADDYLNANSVALTNCGTRSKRLELIQNRLETQLTTLEELKSDNEDADLAETAIKLSSAQYAYDAALMATSKILQENLLNYI